MIIRSTIAALLLVALAAEPARGEPYPYTGMTKHAEALVPARGTKATLEHIMATCE